MWTFYQDLIFACLAIGLAVLNKWLSERRIPERVADKAREAKDHWRSMGATSKQTESSS